MPFCAGEKLDPYEILAPIGAAGMGEVHKARDSAAVEMLLATLARKPQYLGVYERA